MTVRKLQKDHLLCMCTSALWVDPEDFETHVLTIFLIMIGVLCVIKNIPYCFSNGTVSVARHRYGLAGDYVIKVEAESLVNSEPVKAQLPYPITVAEPISGVGFQFLKKSAALLHRRSNATFISNRTSFTVVAERGILFVFSFSSVLLAIEVYFNLSFMKTVTYNGS